MLNGDVAFEANVLLDDAVVFAVENGLGLPGASVVVGAKSICQ